MVMMMMMTVLLLLLLLLLLVMLLVMMKALCYRGDHESANAMPRSFHVMIEYAMELHRGQ